MFRRLWGPTVAAVSVVLDQSEEPAIVSQALDGLLLTARIAAHHHVDEVLLLFHSDTVFRHPYCQLDSFLSDLAMRLLPSYFPPVSKTDVSTRFYA